VDISETKKHLEGEPGQMIAQKGIIVSILFDSCEKQIKIKK
jgi:hypothetical protein